MTLPPLLSGAIILILIAANRCQSFQENPAANGDNEPASKAGNQDRRAHETTTTMLAAGAAGYLLADPTNERLNSSNALDSKLADILTRNGPDMRPMRDFRDFDDISVDVARRAWQLMHDHAVEAVIGRVSAVRPFVERALQAANVSVECVSAAAQTMDAAQRLDSWAIQLITAWGNFPPTGIFEGTYGDIGSFHGCVGVPQNPVIGHAHYCTIAYRPVLPVRKEYELIIRGEPDELLHMFDRKPTQWFAGGEKRVTGDNSRGLEDAFSDLLRHAQYNHYVYYKFGTCFPIQCSPFDVQRLAKLLGRESILMSGPVKCHSKFKADYEQQQVAESSSSSSSINSTSASNSKSLQISTRDLNDGVYIWKPHITRTQKIALVIISIVSLFIVSMTLVDAMFVRLPQFYDTMIERQRRCKASAPITQHNGNVRINGSTSRQNRMVATCSGKRTEQTNDNDLGSAEFDTNNNMSLHQLNEGSRTAAPVAGGARYSNKVASKATPLHDEDDDTEIPNHMRSTRMTIDDPADELELAPLSGNAGRRRKVRAQDGRGEAEEEKLTRKQRSPLMEIVHDCSIITNVKQFFHVSPSQLKNDILCINGIRCITMSWIIITHTMQYNDWSAFARTREIETHLKSLINQPLFNGSYLVDTFFLVSGLLTSLSSFRNVDKKMKTTHSFDSTRVSKSRQQSNANVNGDVHVDTTAAEATHSKSGSLLAKFSPRSYLIGRYLRLTPQIMLVSILFILLPLLSKSGGPHWYTITGEYSENCSQNWWLNLLYIQAFYRSNEMCNFVCWWISVDMFYHLFALAVILLILYYGHKAAVISCSLLVIGHWIVQVSRHYQLGLPPNLLSTIPQTGAMWSEMTLESFWTPYAHAFPFFLGLYIGYLMAKRDSLLANWFNLKRALIGWILATSLLVTQSYSTYFWVIGEWRYTRLVATLFYLICPIIWATCLSWIIVACQYGYGSWINSMLSCKLFIVLGKASYIVYLSHFLVLFSFFGSQNLLLEPTQLVMLYVIIGNICLSMMLGSCLCIVYEMPWLKAQKRIMKYVR